MDQIYSAGYVFLLYDKTKRMIEKWDVSKKLQEVLNVDKRMKIRNDICRKFESR